jgi:hypothetical protein
LGWRMEAPVHGSAEGAAAKDDELRDVGML